MENKEAEASKKEASGQKPGPKEKGGPRSKKNVEDKLDDLADRFAKVMTDGAKRMEEVFVKGVQTIRDNPSLASGRVKGFFTSSTGGAVLVVIGFVWFFYAAGLLDEPVFPIIVIVLGLYLMYRYREK